MSTLQDLVAGYIAARAQRVGLESQAKEIKSSQEDPLKERILAEMSAQGVKSANIDGMGRVASVSRVHLEITNIEALAMQMLRGMVQAHKEGRPMSEGLLLQRRPNRENIEALLAGQEVQPDDEVALNAMGIKQASKTDLSFTKE